jgi:DNA replication licensing factor MCM6
MAAGQGGRYYVEQIREMQEFEYTVLYVDFSHLLEREEVLANAIQTQYYRQVDSHVELEWNPLMS